MSVRKLGNEVAKHLYIKLKPLGFSKKGLLFSREQEGYIELYLIEGSRWNSGEEPWDFTVDVGVFFPEIPAFEAKGMWRHCHALGSAVRLLANDVPDLQVSSNTIEEVSNVVFEIINTAINALPTLIGPVKPRAAQGLFSPLPLPKTWKTDLTHHSSRTR